MPQRNSNTKARAPARGKTAPEMLTAPVTETGLDPAAQVREMARQRDQLAADLDAARRRIQELERLNEHVVNRIDWVLDSLHNLVEQET